MTWAAAIRWALIRALDTGMKQRVVAYRSPGGSGEWHYLARHTSIAWRLAAQCSHVWREVGGVMTCMQCGERE